MPKAAKTVSSPVAPVGSKRARGATRKANAAPGKDAMADDAAAAADDSMPAEDRFLKEQRALLLAERASSLHQADSLQAEAEQLAEDMEPGDIQFDEESGEGGTMNVERERDLALSAQARQAVEEIERALGRIDAGNYGICDRCGQPIPRARLKALPHASMCVACKSGGLSRR